METLAMIPTPCLEYVLLWAFRMALDTGGTLVSEPFQDKAECVEAAKLVEHEFGKRPECIAYVVREPCA
jgi:hypothetical protein